jgi:glycosyltransferase involved in cell wall biosynthesis
MELSIVSTIYNDAKTVELLVNEFINVVKPLKISFEIILVNDASLYNSEAVIKSICEKYL